MKKRRHLDYQSSYEVGLFFFELKFSVRRLELSKTITLTNFQTQVLELRRYEDADFPKKNHKK